MTRTLARHTFGRVLLLPLVIIYGAYSWLTIINGTPNEQDTNRTKHWWGWLDPRMEPHWQRVSEGQESAYETLKNVGSERSKLDGQRQYKAGSFTLVVSIAAALIVGVAVGLFL